MSDKSQTVCIKVSEAAKLLEVSQQTIRMGLITGALPFGVAIKGEKSWNYKYVIPRKRFEKWLNGDDLANRIPLTDNIIKFEDGRVFVKSSSIPMDNDDLRNYLDSKLKNE